MSSRAGPRAAGTDGSDFQHRERVASQHKQSVQGKARIRKYLLFNILVNVVQAVLFALSHFDLLPEVEQFRFGSWQTLLMISAIPSFIGLSSLSKNRKNMLQTHNFGILVFGIGGLALGAFTHFQEVMLLINGEETVDLFGFPRCLIIFNFIAVMFAFHMMSLVTAMQLLKAWDYKKSN